MRDYHDTVETYKLVLKKNEKTWTKEQLEHFEKEIKTLELMRDLDREERLMMFDTGECNNVVKAYCRKAMGMYEMDKKDIDAVLSSLDWLFDAMTAELALQ